MGNSTLSVLLTECGLFTSMAFRLSSLVPTAAFQWNKTGIGWSPDLLPRF